MNHCVPEWSIEEDFRSFQCLPPADNHLKPLWPQNELEELLRQNGHVVKNSQTHRKTMTSPSEIKPCQKRESTGKVGSSKSPANVVHEETAPWLQYPVEDSLEKEFCPEIFCELPATESPAVEKSREHETPERNGVFSDPVFQQSKIPQLAANVMMTHQSEFGGDRNFTNLSRTTEGESAPPEGHLRGKIRLGDQAKGEVGETSSMVTKESNMCASNQVHNWFGPGYTNTEKTALAKGVEEDALTKLGREKAQTDVRETTVTSSSGGSGCTVGRAGRQSADPRIHKRKGRDVDESELHSTEEAEYDSMERSRQSHRSASGRRRRAAEVHNLSERRRRDRINERMRALQELIPRCNKSDRASMLDEAIEYLKSLQLQVQIMWMRSGLAPMMFPGVHHYMPQMGMGMGMVMGHSSMPSIPFPGVPPVNIPPASSSNPTNQMQNAHIPTSYARYVGFQHMQPSPQMMNLFAYGAPLVQQNQAAALATSKCAPCVGEAPSENVQDGSTGRNMNGRYHTVNTHT